MFKLVCLFMKFVGRCCWLICVVCGGKLHSLCSRRLICAFLFGSISGCYAFICASHENGQLVLCALCCDMFDYMCVMWGLGDE